MEYNYTYTPEYGFQPSWQELAVPTDTNVGVVPESYTVPEAVSLPVEEVQIVQTVQPVIESEFDRLEWSTCDYDSSGKPIGYDGKLWSQYAVLKLRTICSKLQVYGVKNARKDVILKSTSLRNN
jgi:hypothetical protein